MTPQQHPLDQVLAKYRTEAHSERNKGDKFERLMQAYLRTEPTYEAKFSDVWLWSEFPFRAAFGGTDLGIDIVCRTYAGEYWAVQCKFYDERTPINKAAVDTFLSTSSRTFTDDTTETARFAARLWISTSTNWSGNAEETIEQQQPQVQRIHLADLYAAPVEWDKLEQGIAGEQAREPKKTLREHQQAALNATHEYFKTADRGKLIMACGTGKTFTSLKIAEHETGGKGLVLFLVPSIALLGQTLREWSAQSDNPINSICICSDAKASETKVRRGKRGDDETAESVTDIPLPASTNPKAILKQFNDIRKHDTGGMTVVFSTYQSIDRISEAQKELLKQGYPEFDLIICDEAHRTTGVTLKEDKDESSFIKVHDNGFIGAKKRLYMTATPKLYGDNAKSKAKDMEAVLCSMDDESLYGTEIYRIGFAEAVRKGLLCDYKVLILTVSEDEVSPAIQEAFADKKQIDTTDAAKLIGCINALSKQIHGDADMVKISDPDPMRRAVAFCQTIEVSKEIKDAFVATQDLYRADLTPEQQDAMVKIKARHIDGSMNAGLREDKLQWLKSDDDTSGECKILTNVRCLSEGVDVPSLDAVLFLSPRNSQIEVVQSVGRVMRKAKGKQYGYIIIPVVVPSYVEAEAALDKNESFRTVWEVLQALRAHDDMFHAEINKLELNRGKSDKILIGRPSTRRRDEFGDDVDYRADQTAAENIRQLTMNFGEMKDVIYGKIVKKVGQQRYWEQWAKDVAQIAERHIAQIEALIAQGGKPRRAFDSFVGGLRKNINPSVTEPDAIEMLSQHIITKPVFEALFENYSFVSNNTISQSMQKVMDLLENHITDEENRKMERFYDSVRGRAAGLNNAEAKQKVIIELYDKFFKSAFPKVVEKLGIVYTPVEVVDFIIRSVDYILKKEFGRTYSDENVHILDPFTGTGTFITRLLQSGLIAPEALERKYTKEIHANEIVLLAYYIASINIENAYHDLQADKSTYTPFKSIVLTDTFQLGEDQEEDNESRDAFADVFPQNTAQIKRQRKAPITVIMSNPPYSIGQKSANDNAQNQKYEILENRIEATYVRGSTANLNKSAYDSYIKAFRWASDRLPQNGNGVIAFVTNGSWLDANGLDGFRKSLEREFSSIYVFNLRGNCRTQGELRRKEAGNVFGLGSRTPVAITILVKKTNQ
jgi:predicted helicase